MATRRGRRNEEQVMFDPARRLATPTSYWLCPAVIMLGAGWGANQFSALLGLYRSELGLSVATVQAMFAVYAVGLIPGLLLGGPVADRCGRRRVVLVFAGLSALATAVLMVGSAWSDLLFVGRFLAGVVTGVLLSAGTAWLKELSGAPYDPSASGSAGARRVTVAVSLGFGLGPLASGLVAQWAPDPLVTAYVPHLLVMLLAISAARAPETVPRRGTFPGRTDTAGVSPAVAGSNRGWATARFWWVVAPTALWVFAAPTIGFAVLPVLVAQRLPGFGTGYAGLVAGLTIGCGLLVQPLGRRLTERNPVRGALAGLATAALALSLAALTALTVQPGIALGAAALCGAAYGLCLVSGLTEVIRLAVPGELASLSAAYYALTYVGFGAPYYLALLGSVASTPVLLSSGAALALITMVIVCVAGRSARPGPADRPTFVSAHDCDPPR